MVIKTINHFAYSNLEVEIFLKKEGLAEKEGEVLEVVLPGRGKVTYLGEGKVCLGDQGQGETMQINYEQFNQDRLTKTVVKNFSYTLRVPTIDCFNFITSHKNCIFLKN